MDRLTRLGIVPRLVGLLVLAAVVPPVAIVVLLGGTAPHAAPARAQGVSAARARPNPSPGAADFAGKFAGVSNQYAQEHGNRARIGNVHCVVGRPGDYMCSYAVTRPGTSPECHLMQARWTPEGASSFTVTLSGRTGRCGSVREAVGTLR